MSCASITSPSIKNLPASQLFAEQHMTSMLPTSPGHLLAGQLCVHKQDMVEPDTKDNDSQFGQDISLDMSAVSCSDNTSFDSKNVSPDSSVFGNEKLPGSQPCYIRSSKLNDSLSLPIPMIQNRDNFDDQDDADADGEGDVSSAPSLSPACSIESPSTPSTADATGTDISSIVIPHSVKKFNFDKKDKNETWKKYLER